MSKHKLTTGPQRRTHPLVWCAAFICAAIAVAVIIAGIVVFVGYLVIHPRVPFISVTGAHLDTIRYDQAGMLQIQITIVVHAENDNLRAHATFEDTKLVLGFNGLKLAQLVAAPFDVRKHDAVELTYVVPSWSIPLGPEQMQSVEVSLERDKITFDLKGSSRTRWRIWILGSTKFWCHLSCQLSFRPRNGSYIPSHCSSKAK